MEMTFSNAKIKRIVFVLFMVYLFTSCDSTYEIKNNGVFLNSWNEGTGNSTNLVLGADPKSFKIIQNSSELLLGKDNKHVYYRSNCVKNLDPHTTKVLKNGFIVDKSHVYFFGYFKYIEQCEIEGVHPSKLTICNQVPWAFDDVHILYGTTKVKVKNPEKFQAISEHWGKTDSEFIFMGNIIATADYTTFQIIDEESAKDKYHDYYLGEIVE